MTSHPSAAGRIDAPRAHIVVAGPTVDDETRCIHYAGPTDVIAIKFHCCRTYYPCHLCHVVAADHPATQWPPAERGERAILCGVCRSELTIEDYLNVSCCPNCRAAFNEGCKLHRHLYFAQDC